MKHEGKRIPVLPGAVAGLILALLAMPARAGENIWTTQGPAPYAYAVARDPIDPLTLYAGTLSGLFKTTDGGDTWTQLDPKNPALAFIRQISVDPEHPNTVYAINSAQVLRSDDLGAHWVAFPAPEGATALAADPRSKTVYIGTGPRHRPEGMMYPASPLSRSTDGGANWSNVGIKSPRAVYSILVDSLHGSVFAGTDFSYARGYYGGYDADGGGIEWSAGGGSFGLLATNFGHSVTALATDPTGTRIFAGTSSGEVFRSADGGNSWASLLKHKGSVTAIVVDPSSPDDLFVATRGSGVYRLLHTAFAPTWIPLHAGLTSFHVSSLVIDPTGKNLHAATDTGVFDIELGSQSGLTCAPGLDHLCLFGSRFRVDLTAIEPNTGRTIRGLAVPQATNFGYFSLPSMTYDPTLPEVMVKMVDATSLPQGGYWVLYSGLTSAAYSLAITDTVTGETQEYGGEGFCGGADTMSFRGGSSSAGMASGVAAEPFAASGDQLRLLSDRFRVTVSVRAPDGHSVPGAAIPRADRFGYFSLPALTGDPNLPEVFVKMLDATSLPGGGFWVFHTGLTTLPYTLTIEDSATGAERTYQNDTSDPVHACGGADTQAFPK